MKVMAKTNRGRYLDMLGEEAVKIGLVSVSIISYQWLPLIIPGPFHLM